MLAVPAPTPVISPVVEFTEATAVLLLDQVPPETVDVKMVVLPTHTAWFPLRDPAEGGEVTVTERVPVTSEHPPVPVTV